eukprot:TRINITY_DN23580_c0_g1_i1.p1 TRINITY_DN23580_c0_g1~~TRINITY_DN23580_c0_g1_i1.p1  ORF type:complete len:313 (-),score=73.24 TRINITY_DN23580_c0_g1_i1:473-1411(-)
MAGADTMRKLSECEAERGVLQSDNKKLQNVLETERGVLREVMATARKAVSEMNRQNESLKARIAELEAQLANGHSSSHTSSSHNDALFEKDIEIQRLQTKIHEYELDLRKYRRGVSEDNDYSGAAVLVTRIQRECGLRLLNTLLKQARRRRISIGFNIWTVVSKGKLLSQPRGLGPDGSLVDSVPCTITTKWTTSDNSPNFDHSEGSVDACRSMGSTTFKINANTPIIPSLATKVSVLFEIAESAKKVAKSMTLTNRSPPRSRHRVSDASPRSPRGKMQPKQRDIVLPKPRHEYSDHLNFSPREHSPPSRTF